MIDLSTDRRILLKPVRSVRFELRDVALTAREVVQMTDGSVWSVAHRRAEYWSHNPKAPLTVAFRFRASGEFVDAVEFIRAAERPFITRELPEVAV
ncbi:hypothetical protein AB0M00_31425 [Streptomyces chartreusis]|uniref:hypothetical protein n=1 Tax=Streptomyces chartreusis TaxID=1969 RepID=UPI003429D85C